MHTPQPSGIRLGIARGVSYGLFRSPDDVIAPTAAKRLETRLGPLAWRSSGQGPALVFFAGALANHRPVA